MTVVAHRLAHIVQVWFCHRSAHPGAFTFYRRHGIYDGIDNRTMLLCQKYVS